MTEREDLPKSPEKPKQRILTPEEDRALAAEEMAKMEKRLESALLPKDKSVVPSPEAPSDAAASTVASADVEPPKKTEVAEAAGKTFQREQPFIFGTPSEVASVISPTSDATVPNISPAAADPVVAAAAPAAHSPKPASDVQDLGKNLSQRRGKGRAAQESALVQAEKERAEAIRAATEMQDNEIKTLTAAYENNPKCADLLKELGALKGKNPESSVIDGIRTKLQVMTAQSTDTTLLPADVSVPRRKLQKPSATSTPVTSGATPDVADKLAPAEPKMESKFVPLAPDEEVVYLDAEGNKKIIKRVDDEYHILDTENEIIMAGYNGHSEAEMKGIVDKNAWVSAEQEPKPADVVHEKKEQDYGELFRGDVWVLRDGEGKFVRAVKVADFLGSQRAGSLVNIWDLDENMEQAYLKDAGGKKDKTAPIANDYKLEDFRVELQSKGYTLDKRGTVSEKTLGKAAVEKVEEEPLLAIGEKARYFVPELKAEYTVERTALGYHFFNDAYDSGIYTEEQMKKTILDAKWEFVEGSKGTAEGKEAPEKKEVPTTPEEPKPEEPKAKEPDETEKKQEHMDGLRTKVEEMRLAYVTTDYKQNSGWMKVKRFFGKSIGEQPKDSDTQSTQKAYERALMELRDAELGELKDSGISGAALRERMGKMLNYYKLDERIKLFETRDQVKIESKNWAQVVVSAVEKAGRAYNGLPRNTKYILGGLAFGTGALTGLGAIGGGAAAVASGLILAKRLLGTAGLAVMVDTGIEHWMEKKKSTLTEQERVADLKTLDDNKEGGQYDLDLMKNFLEKDIKSLGEKFKAQKKEALIRRSAVWGTAVAGMAGIGVSWANHLPTGAGNGSHEDRMRDILKDYPEESAAVTPATAASAVEQGTMGSPVSSMSPQELDHFREVNGVNPAEVAASTTSPALAAETMARMTSLREEYTVTAADGRNGLWGVFEKQLPADMPKGEKNLVIARLEGTLQAKLHDMSPAQLKEVGFRTENINKIYPGDKLNFGKLLTAEEIRSAFEAHVVPASVAPFDTTHFDVGDIRETVEPLPVAAAEVTHAIDPMDQAVFEEKVSQLAEQPMTPLDQPVVHPDPTAAVLADNAAHGISDSSYPFETTPAMRSISFPEMVSPQELANPARLGQFMAEHPEMTPSYQNTLRGMRMAIFDSPQDIHRTPLIIGATPPDAFRTQMSWVMETNGGLQHGQINRFDFDHQSFPLKSDQIDRLSHLVRAAAHPKIFGEIGRPLLGEKVNQYMERIAALATALHKERELAYLVMKR